MDSNKITFYDLKLINETSQSGSICFSVKFPLHCQIEAGDHVGVFRAGWSKMSQCLKKRPVIWRSIDEERSMFMVIHLDDSIWTHLHLKHQLVYVRQDQRVIGVSSPFSSVDVLNINSQSSTSHRGSVDESTSRQSGRHASVSDGIRFLEIVTDSFPRSAPCSQSFQCWRERASDLLDMINYQFKIEAARRRIDQIYLLAQIHAYRRYLRYMNKKEDMITEYLRRNEYVGEKAEFDEQASICRGHTAEPISLNWYMENSRKKIEKSIRNRARVIRSVESLVCASGPHPQMQKLHQLEYQYESLLIEGARKFRNDWDKKTREFEEDVEFATDENLEYELQKRIKALLISHYEELMQLTESTDQFYWQCEQAGYELVSLEMFHGREMYETLGIPTIESMHSIGAILAEFPTTRAEKKLIEPNFISNMSKSDAKVPQPSFIHTWKQMQNVEARSVLQKGIWLDSQIKTYLNNQLAFFKRRVPIEMRSEYKRLKLMFAQYFTESSLFVPLNSYMGHFGRFESICSTINDLEFDSMEENMLSRYSLKEQVDNRVLLHQEEKYLRVNHRETQT